MTCQSQPGKADAGPWYAGGLRFTCQPDCGVCCTNHGDHAYVYLEGDDLQRLADFFELTPSEFIRHHTERDDGHLVLRMDSPACPFLDGQRCTVYPARPTQCRTFPFWEENLETAESWRALASFCPGIDRGERHPLAVIREHLDARRSE